MDTAQPERNQRRRSKQPGQARRAARKPAEKRQAQVEIPLRAQRPNRPQPHFRQGNTVDLMAGAEQ